jgi:D-glycero-alpha-D-manno-heptose 1-phosphate guanylyltransferase
MECIILAGGLGTRLKGVIGDNPKCMAQVNGMPFLHYVFDYVEANHCKKVILSLGYKHEIVLEWLKTENREFTIDYMIEQEPLGTGGGISLAMQKATDDNVVVLNGDTMFCVDLEEMMQVHQQSNATTTIALKHMKYFERYGCVNVTSDHTITAFEEKKYCDNGFINGGVYIINKATLLNKQLPTKYSFEKDYLEAFVSQGLFRGFESEAYFIDIGVPSDYRIAQEDFKTMLP